MATETKTGFIGLGLMGEPMARNVLQAGFPLTVWNRSPEKAAALAEAGATVASSPAEVGAASEVLVTMVSDDAALEAVLFGPHGAAAAMAEGSTVIDMSTTSIPAMEKTASTLAERGIGFVDAPVFGSTEPAASGDLWAIVGASDADLARVRPQLDAMTGSVFHMGPVGAGSAMKVSGNLIVTGMLALLGESMAIGQRAGLDQAKMLEVLDAIDFKSPLYTGKGQQVIDNDFAPRFPLKHALKDARLAASEGARLGVPTRSVDGVVADFAAAAEAGHGEEDCIAVIKGLTTV